MKSIKKYILSLTVILLQIIVSMRFFITMGSRAVIPTHWNIRGEVDGWMPILKASALFIGTNVFILLLMVLLPFISPKYREGKERFKKIIPQFTGLMNFFFGLIHIYSMYLSKYPQIGERGNYVLAIIGIMFVAIGNLLPKIPQNFFAGIRTPWALNSEENWHKTHRLGGKSFVMGGVVTAVASMFPRQPIASIVAFAVFMLCVLIPVVYSFILFKRTEI